MLWFTQNPESFLITFNDNKQLKLINSKNLIIEADFSKEQENMVTGFVFAIVGLLAIYYIGLFKL